MYKPEGLERLYIDFDSFFASVEQELQPHLRDRPMAVVPLESEHTCCIAASYQAKACGVKTGTGVREAKAMCPDIVFTRARHDVYVRVHGAILRELDRHLPVSKVRSIDEMVCALKANEARDPEGLAARIKRGLAENVGPRITASIGFAANELLAKIAAEMRKPDGLTILPTEALPQALVDMRLKLTDIPGVSRGIEHRLARAGVHSISDLYELAPRQARAIWGSVGGERFLARLKGYEVPEEATHKRMFGHSRVLPGAWRTPDRARACARLLTVKAARRLRREPFLATRFTLCLRGTGGTRWERETHFEPARDDHTMLIALERLHAAWLAEGRAERLKQVGVVIHGLVPRAGCQLSLFAAGSLPPREQARWERLSEVADELIARFGSRALSHGPVPEQPPGGYAGAKIAFNRVPDQADFL